MHKHKIILLILVLILSVTCFAYGDEWDAANLQTKRLAPTAFPELPKNIIRELQTRGCTIPQTYDNSKPHNVIHGEFAKKGQYDWAVLCSKNFVSVILIFWGGSEKNISEIAEMPDKTFLQGVDGGRIGYSRAISIVKQYIMDHYKAYGGLEPPPIDHKGIDDAFIEKASLVHYYYRGKWLQLTGAD